MRIDDDLLDNLADAFMDGNIKDREGLTLEQYIETCTSDATYYGLPKRTLLQAWQNERRHAK